MPLRAARAERRAREPVLWAIPVKIGARIVRHGR
jgi:hypothetical protein